MRNAGLLLYLLAETGGDINNREKTFAALDKLVEQRSRIPETPEYLAWRVRGDGIEGEAARLWVEEGRGQFGFTRPWGDIRKRPNNSYPARMKREKSPEPSAVVYWVCTPNGVVYVGSTRSGIRTRLLQHVKSQSFFGRFLEDADASLEVHCIHTQTTKALLDLEKLLIRLLEPELNVSGRGRQ